MLLRSYSVRRGVKPAIPLSRNSPPILFENDDWKREGAQSLLVRPAGAKTSCAKSTNCCFSARTRSTRSPLGRHAADLNRQGEEESQSAPRRQRPPQAIAGSRRLPRDLPVSNHADAAGRLCWK